MQIRGLQRAQISLFNETANTTGLLLSAGGAGPGVSSPAPNLSSEESPVSFVVLENSDWGSDLGLSISAKPQMTCMAESTIDRPVPLALGVRSSGAGYPIGSPEAGRCFSAHLSGFGPGRA